MNDSVRELEPGEPADETNGHNTLGFMNGNRESVDRKVPESMLDEKMLIKIYGQYCSFRCCSGVVVRDRARLSQAGKVLERHAAGACSRQGD